jgi:hypothetical protein
MAIASGLAAQLGMVAESVYGTFVAPTRFLPFEKESLKLDIARDELDGSIGQTTSVARSDRWAAGVKDVKGNINLTVLTKGFGLVLQHMLGSNTISTPGGGTLSRDHTCVLADLVGKMLTIQVGRPDVGGTVRAFSYLGCKIESWELSNAIGKFLELNLNIDGRNEDTAQALATASYAASATALHWAGCALTIGGAAYNISDIKIKGNNGIEGKRYNMSGTNNTLKNQPIKEKLAEISGEIDSEFLDLTAYTRFTAGTAAAIVATWQGSLIEGALYNQLVVTMPVCRFDGDTPNVDGAKRLGQKLPFKALNDGTQEPITIVYRTTDTAV